MCIISRDALLSRIGVKEACKYARLLHESTSSEEKEVFYQVTLDTDIRVSYNALWILNHLPAQEDAWLQTKQDELINRSMHELHGGCRRMLLSLLARQTFTLEHFRNDFLDFCINNMQLTEQPYATRALCMRLAYAQCKLQPELLCELRLVFELLASEPLSPGVKAAFRKIKRELNRNEKSVTNQINM